MNEIILGSWLEQVSPMWDNSHHGDQNRGGDDPHSGNGHEPLADGVTLGRSSIRGSKSSSFDSSPPNSSPITRSISRRDGKVRSPDSSTTPGNCPEAVPDSPEGR